ncbi:MAG TPA: hypothetical protein VFB63_34375, partial [Bryobacteraceae bacterium]|nr:hypothetical protein [Bryobacteraceae bacterium]
MKTIRTDSEVSVGLADGETLRGKLQTRDEKIEIISENARHEAAPAQIVALRDAASQRDYERLLHPSWTRVWAGTATLGMAG